MRRSLRRQVRAQWRDARVLFQESRNALTLFLVAIIGGALAFWLVYTFPGTNQHPGFGEALYAAFSLIFFETVLPFPE